MSFKDHYTTIKLIADDKSGKEVNKTEVSTDAYLNAEMTEELIAKLEQVRLGLILR